MRPQWLLLVSPEKETPAPLWAGPETQKLHETPSPLWAGPETQMLSETWHLGLLKTQASAQHPAICLKALQGPDRPHSTHSCRLRPTDIAPLHTKDWEGPRLLAKGRERESFSSWKLILCSWARGLEGASWFFPHRSRKTHCPTDKWVFF